MPLDRTLAKQVLLPFYVALIFVVSVEWSAGRPQRLFTMVSCARKTNGAWSTCTKCGHSVALLWYLRWSIGISQTKNGSLQSHSSLLDTPRFLELFSFAIIHHRKLWEISCFGHGWREEFSISSERLPLHYTSQRDASQERLTSGSIRIQSSIGLYLRRLYSIFGVVSVAFMNDSFSRVLRLDS